MSQARAPTAAHLKGGRYAGSHFAARFELQRLNVGSLLPEEKKSERRISFE